MSPLEITGLMVAALGGVVTHELAHYAVWRLTGRQPQLDVWGLEVRPRAGPTHVTVGDRVAAAAPLLFGLPVVAGGVLWGNVYVIAFGAGVVIFPSWSDLGTMAGVVEWKLQV